jgi:glycosyltransferase involved in cell wall biosynthesis
MAYLIDSYSRLRGGGNGFRADGSEVRRTNTKRVQAGLIDVISFIIPAHNEQALLGRTLQAIHDAAHVVGQPYEIIVVDDASTDATAEVARQNGATVVPVTHRQIAATRNSGGRAARGDRLFFVDADTTINARAVAEALRYMDKGAVGGGGPTLFDGKVPLPVQLFAYFALIGAKLVGFTGGAFMFCTRAAFQATGGFNERLYWAEEGVFAMALKRQGRFAVLWRPVFTSPRRIRTISGGQLLGLVVRIGFSPFKTFTRRASVEKIWYDSNRAGDDTRSGLRASKVSHCIGLLIFIVLFTAPIWYFIPWSLTPQGSLLGDVRFVIETFLCHVGLVFWPLVIVLVVSLFRRMQWIEWIKLAAVTALCCRLAWDAAKGVFWFWTWLFHKLAHLYQG